MRNLSASQELFRTCRVPRGVLDRARLGAFDIYPAFMHRGDGPYVWDVDGNRYVDWVLGKGPVTLGHANPDVTRAIVERARDGFQLSMAPREYALLAERLAKRIRGAEKTIFLKNGSDAVFAAVRLARAFAERDLVLTCGYHSWHDAFVPAGIAKAGTPASARVDFRDFGYDLRELEVALNTDAARVAAVLVTPEIGLLGGEFLRRVRDLARAADAIFILDEVRCGFHLTIGGSSEYYDIDADLLVYSKGMSNGYPLSAVVGRADIMDAVDKTFIFGSYFYDALGLAAGLATLDVYEQRDVIGHMWSVSSVLMKGIDEIFALTGIPARCCGPPPMLQLMFEDANVERMFFDACAVRGVLWFPEDNQTTSLAHTSAQVEETLDVCESVAREIANGFYAGRRVASRELSPAAIQRYEARRLARPGTADPEHIHGAMDASWPPPRVMQVAGPPRDVV